MVERIPSAPMTIRRAGPQRPAVGSPTENAGDGAVVVSLDIGDGDAETDVDTLSSGSVDEDRVEDGAAGRVEGVDAVGRLEGDWHDLVGVPERGASYGRCCGGDDLVEQAPASELQHAAAHEGVSGQGVGSVAAAVDEEDAQAVAGEEVCGGGAGRAGADDDDVVGGVGMVGSHVASRISSG